MEISWPKHASACRRGASYSIIKSNRQRGARAVSSLCPVTYGRCTGANRRFFANGSNRYGLRSTLTDHDSVGRTKQRIVMGPS